MWDVNIFFQQECIPVGCVPSAAVAVGGGLHRGLSAWGGVCPGGWVCLGGVCPSAC